MPAYRFSCARTYHVQVVEVAEIAVEAKSKKRAEIVARKIFDDPEMGAEWQETESDGIGEGPIDEKFEYLGTAEHGDYSEESIRGD